MSRHPLLDQEARSKVEQIVNGISQAITAHRLAAGGKLPSIRQLAKECGMSPFTVSEAYEQLVQRGWISAKPASGFYVSRRNPPMPRSAPALSLLPLDADRLLTGIYDQDSHGMMAGCGWLPEDWYDEETLIRILRRTAREQTISLRYGQPKGLPALREYLCGQLHDQGMAAGVDQIITTQGATHALELICSVLRVAGQAVLVDDPGYCNLLSSLTYQGCRLHGVTWTEEGPDLTILETLMATHRPRVFFTNPWQQNPTGASYSARVAHEVLRLAQQYDVMIVEDNVSADLLEVPANTLAAMDGLNRVLYLSSYSKSLSPSLRVGYIAAPLQWAESIMRVKMLHGLTTPVLNEQLVLALCNDGKRKRHNQRLKHNIQDATTKAINYFEMLGWEVFSPTAKGMFIWARPTVSQDSLLRQAQMAGIFLAPGKLFRPDAQETDWLRFNSAYLDNEVFRQFLQGLNQK